MKLKRIRRIFGCRTLNNSISMLTLLMHFWSTPSYVGSIRPGSRLVGLPDCPSMWLGVSDAVRKGRHTTRVRELHTLTGSGMVADTPGLREIGMWEVDPGELEWAFVEFRQFLNTCKYYDCTHVHEPGCAVRAAHDRREISDQRYESYVRMLQDEDATTL